jgi:alpha-mannosidase II
MPFSSYIGGNARRGNVWPSSLLPTISPTPTRSKHPSRKSRKRTALINFIFTNFFTIALSISLCFLLITILLFGIPKPLLSSPFKSKPPSYYRVRNRKPPQNDNSNGNSSNNFNRKEDGAGGATVDITTKGLYDRIQFLDEDGGPWKQGWRVSYKGDEWNSEKLKVFVVPHSHNDPGWKLTVEEYYDMQSRHILDTIVHTLSKVIIMIIKKFILCLLLLFL